MTPIPIGRDVFDLVFTPEPIMDDDGLTCAARVDDEGKKIIVSGRIPAHLRPQVVAAVVNEIWMQGKAVENE